MLAACMSKMFPFGYDYFSIEFLVFVQFSSGGGGGGGEGGEWPKSCDVTFVSTVYLGSFEFISKVESMSLLNPSDFNPF